MTVFSRWSLPCLALLAMTACATRAPAPMPTPVAGDPQLHQQQRETALLAVPDWSLAGRVALSNGRDGGSGRIDWQQHGDRYEVSLSAPVTRQSWRLSGAPGHATLEGLPGGPREGADAGALLLEATRWDIPVEALASWVRGMGADPARFGQVQLAFGSDGRLTRLGQAGWTIDYSDWRATGQGWELPNRLNAVRDEAKVRLIVDAWQAP